MIEPEIAFANIDTATESAEKLIKYVIQKVLVECEAEYGFIEKFVSKGVVGRLKMVSEKAFARLPYEKMVSILKDAVASGHEFEDSDIKFGMDFGSEHERYIAETVVKGPVFATHYPRGIKSFYMRVTEKDAKTVDSFDLLIPGIGELVGGSARENNLDILIERMKETSTPVKGLE